MSNNIINVVYVTDISLVDIFNAPGDNATIYRLLLRNKGWSKSYTADVKVACNGLSYVMQNEDGSIFMDDEGNFCKCNLFPEQSLCDWVLDTVI